MRRMMILVGVVCLIAALSLPATAQVYQTPQTRLEKLAFRPRSLQFQTRSLSLSEAQQLDMALAQRFIKAPEGLSIREVYVDVLTGLPALVNGTSVPWFNPDEPPDLSLLNKKIRQFIIKNPVWFAGLSPEVLQWNEDRSGPLSVAPYLVMMDYDVVVNGIRVESARVVFRFNHGRLIQFGAEGVNPAALRRVLTQPSVPSNLALQALARFIKDFNPERDTLVHLPSLKLVPEVRTPAFLLGQLGRPRLDYRLVWTVQFRRLGQPGTWTAWIDAFSGDVVTFFDANLYGTVKGGVYPSSPATTPETTLPLPFADIRNSAGTLLSYTNSGGVYSATTGTTVKTNLNGKYVRINDSCGSISLSATAPGDLDFGTSGGTDCVTPGFGGAGNTHSARSCFYHVNRIKEKGRAWLPSNSWLQAQLTANVNLNQTCNAFWNGSTINFFKSGGGCSNTGEIAAIFLHEYGHGLDSNDGLAPADGGTGEAYGDTVAFLETHDSCIGPGFLSSNCSGYGDSCTSCTGVRDVDYAKHTSGTPATTQNFTKNNCPTGSGSTGPCGREVHCESYVASEAVWDLANRDLPAAGVDAATAWYILDRLFYLSRPTSGQAFNCTNFVSNGCSVSNWYQTFLAVDDDDGNLNNGTPHGNAIYNAFNRHGIACGSPPGNSTTCPSLATPTLTATGGTNSASLSWSAVSGASRYVILRNDRGCSQGFTPIAKVTGTSFTDNDVAGGFTFYYRVLAEGASSSCFSALSACKSVTPTGGGGGGGGDTALTNGVSQNDSLTASTRQGTWKYYYVDLASGDSNLVVDLFNLNKDADLYVRFNAKPTLSSYDCRPYKGGTTSEQCSFATPTAGRWWIGVNNWDTGTITYTVRATWTEAGADTTPPDTQVTSNQCGTTITTDSTTMTWTGSDNITPTASLVYSYRLDGGTWSAYSSATSTTLTGLSSGSHTFEVRAKDQAGNVDATPASCTFTVSLDQALSNGVPVDDTMTASTRQGTWKYYYVDIAAGDTNLVVDLLNLSKDLDLYVRFNAKPTLSTYDCRPYKGGLTSEQCSFATPSAGRWWIGVNNWDTGTATYTVKATWTPAGGGGGGCSAATATYSNTYKTPVCTGALSECDSGTLLDGRGNISGGPEPNQPNTLFAGCADGQSGTYHSDESVDRIKVTGPTGGCLAPGAQVTVTITVYCYSSSDSLDVYYTSNADAPSWQYIGTGQCSSSGIHTFTANITLANTTGLHAVRANFRYQGSASTCTAGSWNDHDDLVFDVQ